MNLYGLLDAIIGKVNRSVKVDEQILDITLQEQARNNINAASKEEVCNPNLLDNWYFGNPVNQRGQMSYINTEWTKGEAIDRWTLQVASLDVANKKLTAKANYGRAVQYINNSSLIGKTVTFSALISSCVNTKAGLIVSDSVNSDYVLSLGESGESGLYSATFIIKDFRRVDYFNLGVIMDTADGYVVIEAIKLELGDTQTLAHQDADGNWVLNEIPNFAEQLAVCAQYNPNTGDFKGAYSMDLLWENASPNSDFAAQTLALDVTGYAFIAIVCLYNQDYPTQTTCFFHVDRGTAELSVVYRTDSMYISTRNATVDATGITFGKGYRQSLAASSTTSDNGNCLPLIIYGIKGVG